MAGSECIPARPGGESKSRGGDTLGTNRSRTPEEGRGNDFAAGRHRTPLTLSVFRNRQRRGLRVMRLRDFGRLADLGGPAGPETESKNFRARRH